jgi:WD40 repeat protein
MSLSGDGKQLASNGMDNAVRIWDVQPFVSGTRLRATLYGTVLLPVRRPQSPTGQETRMGCAWPRGVGGAGGQHNYEKNLIKTAWAPDNVHVAAGSADRNVYIWNSLTGKVIYCLPGHKSSVNDVDFHPKEPIGMVPVSLCSGRALSLGRASHPGWAWRAVLSCSSDKRAFLGELQL